MREIPLFAFGKVVAYTLVDDDDFSFAQQYRWRIAKGYPIARINGKWSLLHRVILGLSHGDPREGDHRDRNPLNNQRRNLRFATTALNAQNRMHPGGSSKHRGVTWHKRVGKWQAAVKLAGRSYYLGVFQEENDAAIAAAKFRAEHMPFGDGAA